MLGEGLMAHCVTGSCRNRIGCFSQKCGQQEGGWFLWWTEKESRGVDGSRTQVFSYRFGEIKDCFGRIPFCSARANRPVLPL